MKYLCDVGVGEVVEVASLLSKDLLKERMLALGITKGTKIEIIRKGPKDNLTVFDIRGVMIALRKEESKLILVAE
ncbi:MAG TPA: ferrous iron transport protein A [Acholeplasmataceae bacterium]|jgi:ferrous iron transport protein A|nr:ferrous iron transport protein A [Acholeplasmataceae bacterium]